jgi:RNA polymerase sigma-70 factor, ECF subfamily
MPAAEPQKPATAAARDEPTVTLTLEQYLDTVYRYALRLTGRPDLAEDVTQETMLRAWQNQRKLRDPHLARIWLLRIATNLWNDNLRRTRYQPRSLECEPPCPRRAAAETRDAAESVRLALAAMDELPPRQRQVIYLITVEELSHAEVAEVLDINLAAVKSNLSAARKEMRRRLKEVYESVRGRAACKESQP